MSMENLLRQYLRFLDVDPNGYFLRLINKSKNHSIDLSNVEIRQRKVNEENAETFVNSFRFDHQIQPLLPAGQFVTIYSREYFRVRCEIEPNIFLAENVARWSTSKSIQTELSIHQTIFERSKSFLPCDNDVPFLYLHSVFPLKKASRRLKSAFEPRPLEFRYPYCLSDNNIVNPNTSAVSNRKLIEWNSSFCRSSSSSSSSPTTKDFDTYARRLTTLPKRIQSSKNRMTY